MCRMFALRATHPTRATDSLLTAPHSLTHQSCCDKEERACHEHGWGIAFHNGEGLHRIRSPRAAAGDPEYRRQAETVAGSTLVAHVRRASAGSVAERNSHPFIRGPWVFAHNGGLTGFQEGRERLLALVPAHLRQEIQGETDSEHIFAVLLGRLEQAAGSLEAPVDLRTGSRVVSDTIRILADQFPGSAAEPTKLNFVLTDGRIMLTSRWGHSLSWLERRGGQPGTSDGPVDGTRDYRAVVVASEPTSSEPWSPVPDRTLLAIDADLSTLMMPLAD